MTERWNPFPDKKKVELSFEETTNLLRQQQEISRRAEICQDKAIWIPQTEYDTPFGLLVFSDPHYGDLGVNYNLMEEHLQIVKETPNLFFGTLGDHTANFSPTVLATGMLASGLTPDMQTRSFVRKMKEMDNLGKLAFMTLGNHDEFQTASGHNPETSLEEVTAPIFEFGGKLDVVTRGGAKYKGIISHKYWGKSKINISNMPKRLGEYERPDYDFSLTGDVHQKSYEEFERAGQEKVAIVAGTYQEKSRYARNKGVGQKAGSAGTTMVFWQDRVHFQTFKDVRDAQQFILSFAMFDQGVLNPKEFNRFKEIVIDKR